MRQRRQKLIRVLAAATMVATVASALPAAIAGAAQGDAACKVHNINSGVDRDSLQRAVRAAEPGDALLVQGTCRGTTLVDKDLDISYMGWAGAPMPLGQQYVTSPRGRIVSGGLKPALVIDPAVEYFTVNPGLVVAGGIVIDDVDAWRDQVSAAWREASPSMIVSLASDRLSDCHLRNDATGAEFARSQRAFQSASTSDQLSLRGSCGGETVIEEPSQVAGWRIALSSMTFGEEPTGADDSGPATLASVSVDAGVDRLVLRDVRVTDGFSIDDLRG